MLLLTWWISSNLVRRRRALASLSILGKWSLVDVLVVCLMVGVLNLDWKFQAKDVYAVILEHPKMLLHLIKALYTNEQICTDALGYSCHNPAKFSHKIDCNVCKTAVAEVVDYPKNAHALLKGIEVSGGGEAELYVAGMRGIYDFCIAVILSIVLSFIVDWYDLQNRKALRVNEEVAGPPEISGTLSSEDPETEVGPLSSAENGVQSTPNVDRRSNADREYDHQIIVERQQFTNLIWIALSICTAIVILFATWWVSLRRQVHGAVPMLMEELLGVVWRKQYSFWLLGWTTARAGGEDFLLMGTFVWFLIVGPIVRSFLCIRASFLTEKPNMNEDQIALVVRRRERLSTWIHFVGAFCAWEVFTIAALMVQLLIPSLTATLFMDDRCSKIVPESNSCFEVEFTMTNTFALVITGGLMLLLVSQNARSFMRCA